MMRSLYSGVSGLKGHQTKMDVVGNNIANVNTTGFKSSRVTFADTLSQTQAGASAPRGNLGGTNPKQIGLGVGVASIDTIFTDGSVQATGKNTDLCLSGNGLFVVKKGAETYYTRDGAFEFDANGNYVLPGSGLKVQGWMFENGNISTNSDPTDIVIQSGKSMKPTATTLATYANNVKADSAVITKVNGCDKTNWTCTNGMPCDLVLTGGIKVAGTPGTTYKLDDVYSTAVKDLSASTAFEVNKYHSPATVTLNGGATHSFEYTSTDKTWRYGYVLDSTTGASANDKVTAKKGIVDVTLEKDYGGGNVRTTTGLDGITYTYGDSMTIENTTIGDTVTQMDASETLVLTLADGTTHDVSPVGPPQSYVIGTDTYTYGGVTSKVVGAKITFTPDKMTVTSSEGDGTSLRFGTTTNINEGYALEAVTGSATATATSPLILTLKDGRTISVTSSSTPPGPYAVGDNYADAFTTTPAQVPNGTKVRIELSDGTFHDDMIPTGTTYTVGGSYTYTSSGGTPTTATIVQYAPLTEITNVEKQTKITGVKYNDNTLVEEIIPGSVTASSTEALSLTFSDQTTQTVTSGTYNIGHSLPITTILNVYDSDGGVHAVPVYFTKTSTGSGVTTSDGNQWTINLDGSNVEGTTNTITDSSGTITVDMKPVTVQFSTSGQMLTGSGNIELTMTNGANHTQTVAIDVSQLTQFVGDSTFNGTTDGNPAGTLKSISIDSSGIIQATYTNGVRQAEGQIAVAQFTNAAGLTKTGSSLYQASNNSGTPNVQTATALGCDITPSALEMSNVDIANEFSDMIITQRGFQSNSKIITVSDEMLETMINMKR